MKKSINRIISLLMTIIFITLIFSCGDSGDTASQTKKEVSSDNTEIQENTETTTKIELPSFNYEGHIFNILVREDSTSSTTWNIVDIVAKEQNGDLINDAVYERNLAVEEKYNITIEEIKVSADIIPTNVNNAVMANDSTYDAVLHQIESTCTIMLNGSLVNLVDAPYLDFTKPWWAVQIMEDVSIGGKIFFATGDICLNDDKATWGILFNKKLANDYNLPNLYDLVFDGNWTIEKFYEYASSVKEDLNGDGVMTLQEDRWGLYDQLESAAALYSASGLKIMEKDKDNNFTYNLNKENSVNLFEKIYNFMSDQTFQFISENYSITDIWATMRAHFRNDQCLFFMTIFGALTLIRDMETDFGLIPLPKMLDNQAEYFTTFQFNNGTAYSIPKSVGDFERSCIILESMAMGSPNTLTTAYYDMTLQQKALRDNESVEIMQLILKSRIFDFSFAFTTIGTMAFLKEQVKSNTYNFISAEASKRDTFLGAVEKILNTVNEIS